MAKPDVGKNYRLDIKEDVVNEAIAWVNNVSRKLFKTYGEIDGEIITVKAKTRILSTYYIVALLSHPKDSFFVPGRLLMELTRRLPIVCSCDLDFLINQGCRCGAFKKEQAKKKKL